MTCRLNFTGIIEANKEMAWLEEQIKACNRAQVPPQPDNAASTQSRCTVDPTSGAVVGRAPTTGSSPNVVTTAELRDQVAAKYHQVAKCLTAPTAASLAVLQAEHAAIRAKFDSVQSRQRDANAAKAKLVGAAPGTSKGAYERADVGGADIGEAGAGDTVVTALFPPAAPWDEAGHTPWSEYTAVLLATTAAVLVSYLFIVRAAS